MRTKIFAVFVLLQICVNLALQMLLLLLKKFYHVLDDGLRMSPAFVSVSPDIISWKVTTFLG